MKNLISVTRCFGTLSKKASYLHQTYDFLKLNYIYILFYIMWLSKPPPPNNKVVKG